MGEVGSTAGPAVGVHSQKLLLCTPWWCQQEKAKENDFLHLFDTFLTPFYGFTSVRAIFELEHAVFSRSR